MAASVGAVVLFGPPGAGKGTQARGLAQRLGVPHISTGDMIRAQVAAGTSTGRQAHSVMAQGSLLPDEWVNRMVESRLREPYCGRGLILDGYPRTRGQAQALEEMLAVDGGRMLLIHIVVGYNEIIRRTTGRRMCPHCGTIYNIFARPPQQDNLCDRDQTALEIRSDDREEVIRERLQAYDRETRPVLECLREKGHVIHEVDGTLAPERVAERLAAILEAA